MIANSQRRRCRLIAAAGSVCAALVSPDAAGVASSDTGININNFLGADKFYEKGYDGGGVVVSSVQAGHLWSGHETLTHVTTFLDNPDIPTPNGDIDRHATWVAGLIGGRPGGPNPGNHQRGIAHAAELWSGAVATAWSGNPYTLSFSWNKNSIRDPFFRALIGGVDGRTADVIDASWGSAAVRDNSLLNARMIDGMINQSGKTVVFGAGSAGNTTSPQPGAYASTFNSITVGHLTSDASSPPYGTRAPFSSYGPNNFWNPATQTVVPGVVASVDLVVPGTNMVAPFYGGTTGGNAGGTLVSGNDRYWSGVNLATPLVTGGAALVVDAGKALFGGGSAIDGRVVKSILQNSASKLAGWDNGQTLSDGVVTTTQSLDYQLGAGRMDLDRALIQYTAGTTDVPGLAGGSIGAVGWDMGEVSEGVTSDYRFAVPLKGYAVMTATLNWFIDNTYDYASDTLRDQSLDNLDLEVWKVTPGDEVPDMLVAQSISTYNNVEHLSFNLPETARYVLRVRWNGEVFDTVNDVNREVFGLAWSGTAALLGDADDNGVVNYDDFMRLWNSFGGPGSFSDGDFNLNGVVDFGDFQILELNWGMTQTGTIDPGVGALPMIPEPVALAPIMIGMLMRRRCRYRSRARKSLGPAARQ